MKLAKQKAAGHAAKLPVAADVGRAIHGHLRVASGFEILGDAHAAAMHANTAKQIVNICAAQAGISANMRWDLRQEGEAWTLYGTRKPEQPSVPANNNGGA